MTRAKSGAKAGSVRVGIGGWTFAAWRDNFFPAGLPHARELEYASARVTAIEINGTFYRHQSAASFAGWRDATPAGFVFSVKAHRATTHGKNLAEAGPAIERFVGSGVGELGEKLGPLFWQLPHTKKFDAEVMDAFLSMLPKQVDGVALRHAVEARHATFLDAAWPELAARHGVAIVIVDSDKQALRGDVTADFVYARLQRNATGAAEGYESAALDVWAGRLRDWSQGRVVAGLVCDGAVAKGGKRDCFAFFISGDKERAPDAAMAMLGRLAS